MGFAYASAPTEGALRQGEVLGGIWEHRVVFPPRRIPAGFAMPVESFWRALAVVLSPDCDLAWDFEMRFSTFLDDDPVDVDQHPQAVTHLLLCEMYGYEEIRPRFGEMELWRRVKQNQDERYHRLPAAPVGEGETGLHLNDLYMDFKKVMSMPTDAMYDGLLAGDFERVALIPEYYIHDLIHRFYGFLSRVAIPD